MLPHNGQGASQSIEDGYTLACCIASYLESPRDSLQLFLKAYQNCRFPHTTKVQRSSREAADIYSQLGEFKEISDQDERYRRIAQKVGTWMTWIWKHDARADISEILDSLRGNKTSTKLN